MSVRAEVVVPVAKICFCWGWRRRVRREIVGYRAAGKVLW